MTDRSRATAQRLGVELINRLGVPRTAGPSVRFTCHVCRRRFELAPETAAQAVVSRVNGHEVTAAVLIGTCAACRR